MKETRTINLNGIAFNIDYDAYQELRDYLHDIELRLSMDEKNDVMADIEARMAELFSKALFAKNVQVINIDMVHTIQARIGAPAEFGENKRPKVKKTKADNSGCWRVFGITVMVLVAVMALPVLLPLLAGFIALIVGLFGASIGIIGAAPFMGIELFGGTTWLTALFIICGLAAVVLPIVMIICSIVSYMRTRRGPKARFWWITLILWALSIVGTATLSVKAIQMGLDITPLINEMWDDDDNHDALATEVRDMPAFNAISVKGAAEVRVHTAPEQQLLLHSNNLGKVTTEVRDSVLYIELQNVRYTKLEVDITVPELRMIRTAGACEVKSIGVLQQPVLTVDCSGAAEIDLNMAVQTLTVNINGGAELDMQGTANQADITLNGAGEIDAKDLVVQSMHINCAGASEAEINVQDELWAQASGASKISYRGNPRVIKQKMELGGSKIVKQ